MNRKKLYASILTAKQANEQLGDPVTTQQVVNGAIIEALYRDEIHSCDIAGCAIRRRGSSRGTRKRYLQAQRSAFCGSPGTGWGYRVESFTSATLAILAELAKTPTGLPSGDDIADRVDTPNDCCIDAVLQTIEICYEECGAVLAAKGAGILELRSRLGAVTKERDDAKTRIAELEAAAHQSEPVNDARWFDGRLVDALDRAYRRATDGETRSHRDGILAILSELAKMPVELPTWKQIRRTWHDADSINDLDPDSAANRVQTLFRDTIAPILAAKDARIAELEAIAATLGTTIGEQASRIAELEARTVRATPPIDARQLELLDHEIKALKELRARNADMLRAIRYVLGGTCETVGSLADDVANVVRERDEANARIADLEKQLGQALEERDNARGELAARMAMLEPMTVDGKTPGQVQHEAWWKRFIEQNGETVAPWGDDPYAAHRVRAEYSAQAVLRAFGPELQRQALEALREQIVASRPSYAIKLIDETIAQLKSAAGSSDLECAKLPGQAFHESAETVYRRFGAHVFVTSFDKLDTHQQAACADAERSLARPR